MSIDLKAKTAHEPESVKGMLEKLQGNILQPHGRNFAVYLLLRFKESPENIRKVLTGYLPTVVKNAFQQYEASRAWKESGGAGPLFGSFFLSADGYRRLGFTDDQIRALLPEKALGIGLRSNFFQGMKAHRDELLDPPTETWDVGYTDRVDALLLLAHDSAADLTAAEKAALDAVASIADVVATERGRAYRDPGGQAYEHFGFADGISQPAFFAHQRPKTAPQNWDPVESLSLVLVDDGAAGVEDAYGSFFVFRKLEQNVRGFVEKRGELAKALGLPPRATHLVGAMAVGRFPDGSALATTDAPGTGPDNDFVFGSQEKHCPLHAHIRKANPRGDLAEKHDLSEEFAERHHRIARRSITYGDRKPAPFEPQALADLPTGGVGVLFGAYQASIANQFAFIQSWLNRTDFPEERVGTDPMGGVRRPGSANTWSLSPTGPKVRSNFGPFVTLKGGEFFFAPSIPFLGKLAPPS
jgi:Dyp-type peroxidase family